MATQDRGNLRLADLKGRTPNSSRLVNVKVPLDTLEKIEELARRLKATKTSVIVALLNEGLEMAKKKKR